MKKDSIDNFVPQQQRSYREGEEIAVNAKPTDYLDNAPRSLPTPDTLRIVQARAETDRQQAEFEKMVANMAKPGRHR